MSNRQSPPPAKPSSVQSTNMASVSPQEKAVLSQSVNFEVGLQTLIRRSERRAWWVAACAVASTLMISASYIFVMPLKEKLPYLVVADPYTGTATLSRIRDSLTDHQVTRSEIINKAYVARYVTARESYEWDLTGRRDWDVVHALGSPQVSAIYAAQYTEQSSYNPDKLYGKAKVARVRVKSIVLTSGPNNTNAAATVRFDRAVFSKSGNRIESVESFVATLAYEYVMNLKMPEAFLIENPMGFQVTSYRIDPDTIPNQAALTRELSEVFTRLGAPELK